MINSVCSNEVIWLIFYICTQFFFLAETLLFVRMHLFLIFLLFYLPTNILACKNASMKGVWKILHTIKKCISLQNFICKKVDLLASTHYVDMKISWQIWQRFTANSIGSSAVPDPSDNITIASFSVEQRFLMPISRNTLGPDGRKQRMMEKEEKDGERAGLMYICHALMRWMPAPLSWL